jgi:hypothetical protein
MAIAPLTPGTVVGTADDCGEVMPSCPLALFPQHCTPPPTMAHAESKPAATAAADANPETDTGLSEYWIALPSRPAAPLPQQSTAPLVRRAHLKS